MKEYGFQLREMGTNRALHTTGKFIVTQAGTSIAIALYDGNDASVTLPKSITSGYVTFRTAETITSVDVYGYTDNGFAFQAKGLKPGDISSLMIDTNRLLQHFVYPINFSTSNTYGDARTISVSAANSTGMFLPDGVALLPVHTGIQVTLAESAKTIDVGVVGVNSGITTDADGFIDGALFTTAGWVPATIGYIVGTNSVYLDLTGGDQEWTSGALFHPASTKGAKAEGTDSATTKNGMYIYKDCIMINSGTNTTELTYTFAGTPTAIKGFIVIGWRLPNIPAYT